jgi:tetratricopeptide (TPR) repeat protein
MLRRWLPAVLIALGALLLIDRWAIVPWQCNRQLYPMRVRSAEVFERTPDPTVTTLAARQLIELARPCMERCPEQLDWLLITAAAYHVIGRYDQAEATYREALRIDQRPEIYRELGLTQLDARRYDDAVLDLAVAFRFSPLAFLDDIPQGYRSEVKAKARNTAMILDVLRRRGAQHTP